MKDKDGRGSWASSALLALEESLPVNVGEVRVGECVAVPAPDSESGSVSMVDDACRISHSAAGGGPEVGGRVRRFRRVVAACQGVPPSAAI